MNELQIMQSQGAEQVLGPVSLAVLAMLREFSREGEAESQSSGRNASGHCKESVEPATFGYFEGRAAVETANLMGFYK